MKLLFDENLSPQLADELAELFPGSTHVHRVSLGSANDLTIWEFTKQYGCMLVSKDSDFQERSVLLGFPPKIVWIKRGNCNTRQIELLLRNRAPEIVALNNDPEAAFLILL